jgi:hypothetical protein
MVNSSIRTNPFPQIPPRAKTAGGHQMAAVTEQTLLEELQVSELVVDSLVCSVHTGLPHRTATATAAFVSLFGQLPHRRVRFRTRF